jgi:hypothetical protein
MKESRNISPWPFKDFKKDEKRIELLLYKWDRMIIVEGEFMR